MVLRLVHALLFVSLLTTAAAKELAIDQAALDAAKPLNVEKLVEPVKSMRLHGDILVPHQDGKGWDYLLFYKYENEPTQLFIVDMTTGRATKERLKDGYTTPWGHGFAPDGRVFIAFWPGGGPVIMVYDPASKKTIDLGKVAEGAASTEKVACSPDGQIFVSTFNQVHAVQIDPVSLKAKDLGLQGPLRDYLAYGYSIAADKDYVYTAAGKIPWTLVAFNRKTGTQETILTTTGGNHLGVQQGKFGCTASIDHQEGPDTGKKAEYWLYQGKAIEKKDPAEAPPWAGTDKGGVAHTEPATTGAQPEVFLENAAPNSDGVAEFWYRLPADKAKVSESDPSTATAEQLGWRRVTLNVDVVPIKTTRLTEMPDGRLFGTVDNYQGHFIYDPKTGKSESMGQIALSHYGTAELGGKIYLSGYPNSQLFQFDPRQPWTAGRGTPGKPSPELDSSQSNPRRLASFRSIILTHHLRSLAVGADGKIYGGGHAERAHVGGGLGWWDPKTQEAGGLRPPFELYDIASLCAANGGHQIVYSSQTVRDPATGEQSKQAKLFVFDVDQKKIVKEIEPLPGASSTGHVIEGLPGKVIGAAPSGSKGDTSVLYQVDLATGNVDFAREVPGKVYGLRRGPGGVIWTFIDSTLVRIDPENGKIAVVGKVDKAGEMAFSGTDVYLVGETSLRKIAGIGK